MNIQELAIPFWKTNKVLNESILLLSENGEAPNASLFFKPDEIISITSADLKKEYVEGKDWILKDGKICKLDNSDIPYLNKADFRFPEEIKGKNFRSKDGSCYVLFAKGEDGFMHKNQLCVTYTHSDTYEPNVGLYGENRLAKTKKMLENGENFTFCFYGDSITTGCDCSGKIGLEPNMPDWTQMIPMELERRYGSKIKRVNTAVGGMCADWGEENAEEKLAAHKPDTALIAFGMNDGTGMVSAENFGKNIKGIMNSALSANPECEFIFIATTLANPESCFDGLQREYYGELLKCARECDVVVNMTSVHNDLLERKRFQDMTGNNINHPNDFLTRVYAQVILEVF